MNPEEISRLSSAPRSGRGGDRPGVGRPPKARPEPVAIVERLDQEAEAPAAEPPPRCARAWCGSTRRRSGLTVTRPEMKRAGHGRRLVVVDGGATSSRSRTGRPRASTLLVQPSGAAAADPTDGGGSGVGRTRRWPDPPAPSRSQRRPRSRRPPPLARKLDEVSGEPKIDPSFANHLPNPPRRRSEFVGRHPQHARPTLRLWPAGLGRVPRSVCYHAATAFRKLSDTTAH